jgi:glucose-6-phosphate 1-dehydrogenase
MRPTVFVLFGATGDLARRMVLPGFHGLYDKSLLPDTWRLIGCGRRQMSDDAFRKEVSEALDEFGTEIDEVSTTDFLSNVRFAGSGFTEQDPGELMDVLRDVRHDFGTSFDLVLYLALPPTVFTEYARAIDAHGLVRNAKVVFEKPYGVSAEDFEELDRVVHEVFDEAQVYRIDHFLGKEATQNLHMARFSNAMLDAVWHRDHVEAVQIDVPETLDIIDRAEFYDNTGALLDMVVTHLFQLAAEVAMEQPVSFEAEDLSTARSAVIDAFRPLRADDVVFGQFDGYRNTDGVAAGSSTDTFAAVRLWVDTDRWRDVPFLLRSGKCLGQDAERITLILRKPEGAPRDQPASAATITFDLAGFGALSMTTVVKKGGAGSELVPATVHIDFGDSGQPLAPYERLLRDVLTGDRSRFTVPEGLRDAWRAISPVLDDRPAPILYQPGSMGPAEADALAEPHGWLATKKP